MMQNKEKQDTSVYKPTEHKVLGNKLNVSPNRAHLLPYSNAYDEHDDSSSTMALQCWW